MEIALHVKTTIKSRDNEAQMNTAAYKPPGVCMAMWKARCPGPGVRNVWMLTQQNLWVRPSLTLIGLPTKQAAGILNIYVVGSSDKVRNS